ncbi:DNA-3-methyladenine glycosylase family protein [Bacillus massiliigorillae]|uniref:DNA-3-methyladenine glycosylase family protein n=1 Tax=Bacillus massiliigorillae TaxID=1243664 RepID=UPI00039C8F12|nr:DNA-3-methyladenine glycosylase [Bacillus massiliigorillae]
METFKYGDTELDYLKMKDEKLAHLIEQHGMIERKVTPDLFTALINSVVSQQISTKAAATVWNRLIQHLGEISPQIIANATVEEIQQCGLSTRKANYIKGIGDAVVNGELQLDEFPKLSDQEVIDRLSSLHGIGVWTAEMLLIFSMQRSDIISWGDLGIRRGLTRLYALEDLTKEQFNEYKKRYSPYGSVASLYIWKLGNNK